MRPHLRDTPADQTGLLFCSTSEILFHFDGLLIPSLKGLFAMLKALILILVSLVYDVHSFGKFIEALIHFQSLFLEALILDFNALLEHLEEGIQFGGSRLISCRAFALWKAFIRGIFRALLWRRSTLV